jgi:nucleotide-binding universal stress UspA family protein
MCFSIRGAGAAGNRAVVHRDVDTRSPAARRRGRADRAITARCCTAFGKPQHRGMILIAYDGSPSADHAIAVAARLLRGGRARIVHVWPVLAFVHDATAFLGVSATAGSDLEAELAREENQAHRIVDRGVALARRSGFDADGDAIRGDASPAQVIESAIDRLKPDLVVMGSRGLTGLKALLSGSVSHHVGAHAHAPVLIVPDAA